MRVGVSSVVHIYCDDEHVHLETFHHVPDAFYVDPSASSSSCCLLRNTPTLLVLCDTVPITDFSACALMPNDYDEHFI